jgi:type I restriction enzyme, S subunit
MDLSTFFQKFDQFADAPDAVAKMRELIMWSAFSGAFSTEERDQHMPEEWAAEGAPTLPAIPSSWKWQRGSEVFDVIRGVSYKKNDVSDSPVAGFFPVLRANNIGNGINFDGLVYVPRDNIRDDQFVRRGDILIAISSGSKKLVGKASPIVSDFIGSFGAFCGIIRNKSAIPDEVLARYFQSPQYTSWVTAAGRGIGINNLGRGDLDSLPVPTPPLAEQKRIVAKVDELMALCDRLEAQQQERETRHAALARASLSRFAEAPTPENLNLIFHPSLSVPPADLRKAILALAVQGKLVPQDPNDELPSVEEFRIAAAALANSLGLRSPKESIGEAEPSFDVPDNWLWIALADLGAAQTGTTPSKNDHAAFNGDIPFIKPADILPDGINYSNESLTRYGAESGSRLAPAGSLLMVCIGTIGKCNLIDRECAFNQQINSLSPVQWVDSQYLLIAVRGPYFQEAAWAKSSSTTIPILNKGKWLSVSVPLPPLAEQRRIVAKVDQLMALVDALETQLAASRATAANLLSALVAELTTATPATEPQSELMAAEDPAPYHA